MKPLSLIASASCVLTTMLVILLLHSCNNGDGTGCTGIQNCDYRFTADDKQWVYVNTNPVYSLFDTAHKQINGKDSIIMEPKADVSTTVIIKFLEVGGETGKCCNAIIDNAEVYIPFQNNLRLNSFSNEAIQMSIGRTDNGLVMSETYNNGNPIPSYNDTALVNGILYSNVKKITFMQSAPPYLYNAPKSMYYAENYGVVKFMLNNGAWLALKK